MKHLNKAQTGTIIRYLLIGGGLILAFFVLRLVNILQLPIFTDEAIYLRWAQIALGDPRWRFISLIDGKQPLLIWLFLPALKLINDPLLAGRLVSVFAGFVGMVGLATFGWYISKSYKGLLLGGLFYLLIPFFLVYDRLAIYDTLLSAISIWALFFSYLLGKKLRLDVALILGTVVGAGLLTKSSANFFWGLLPATLLLSHWTKKNWKKTVIKWVGLVAAVIIQSQIYNNILRLSEFRHVIGEKNLQFIYSVPEFLSHPFLSLRGNLTGLTVWFVSYLTLPLTLFVIVSCVWYLKKNWREAIFFLTYFLVPYLSLAAFGKVIYPRFILFMVPPLLIPTLLFSLHLFSRERRKLIILAAAFLLALPLLYFDLQLLINPVKAPLPTNDRFQYIVDWPAGYGIKEIIAYLQNESRHGPLIIGTEGTFGLYPMALELYLGKDPNITIKAYWPVGEIPQELISIAAVKPVFFVFKETQNVPQNWPLKLIAEYQRGDGPTYLKFYRVLPKT